MATKWSRISAWRAANAPTAHRSAALPLHTNRQGICGRRRLTFRSGYGRKAVVVGLLRRRSDLHFSIAFGVLFFGLGVVTMARHELWRDEWHPWMLARQSPTLADLFQNKIYDGHPSLWYLALFFITRFTRHAEYMQAFHLLVATATAYIVLRHSGLPRVQRVLFVFGYYLFFEYAAISRGYALGVLLTAVFCALSPVPRARPIGQVVVLTLMMQTSAFGVLLAVALLPLPAVELLRRARHDGRFFALGLCAVIVAAGLARSATEMLPPPDGGYAPGWYLDYTPAALGKTVNLVWKAFVPVPQVGLHFWNTNIVTSSYVQLPLALGVLALTVMLLRPYPLLLAIYGGGLTIMLAFSHVKYAGYVRHHGHIFILFMACWWLAYAWFRSPTRLASQAVTALLGIQCVAGVYAVGMDWAVPFSSSKTVAEFLTSTGRATGPIAGYRDTPASAIAGYLDREVYYLGAERLGTFVILDSKGEGIVKSVGELEEAAHQLSLTARSDVTIVFDQPIDLDHQTSFVLLAQFTHNIEPDERYYVYRLAE